MGSQLRLVDMDETDNVVRLPVIRSTFNEAWALREGQMKKRGDGPDKTKALWDKAAKKVGQAQLLGALKAYFRESKEPASGYPGLSVWLNGQRYGHWMASEETTPSGEPRAACPEPIRGRIAQSCDESWIRSYLDPCAFHEDGWITPATEFGRKKLLEKGAILKAAGLVGIKKKGA